MSEADGKTVVVGTRGSRLALVQADGVIARIRASRPDLDVRREIIKTVGDKVLDTALSKIGDKGLFTKELEAALLARGIDAAVHSLKDVPTQIPAGLVLGAILEREDPCDVLVSPTGKLFADLPAGARVGTSSLRRRAQMLALRPDLSIVDLRGNVPTRVECAEKGDVDAVVLARAGLVRLGMQSKITEVFGPDRMLPAVGQGAVAVEIRADDERIAGIARRLDDRPTHLAVTAERALLARLEGGCQVPIGALARLADGQNLVLQAVVADLDGRTVIRSSEAGTVASQAEATAIGERLAERLLAMGARAVLDAILIQTRHAAQPPRGGGGRS